MRIQKRQTLPMNYLNELAKASPAGMAYRVSGGRWKPARHLLLASKKLVDVAARRSKRLIFTLPPRHGKSELISKYFPSWYLGGFPEDRVILTSYEADFATSWGRKARDITEEYGESMFGVKVRQDSSAANRWEIEGHGGGMVTAGAGGPITGKGGDVIIIDDPFKNAQEANSPTVRNKIWEWYQSTLYTRLEPDGALIIVMTRWHEDDLVGRLLNPEFGAVEDWEIINLPAVAEGKDLLGREPGEALWPERYDIEELGRIKETVGSYWWNALYQQRPSPPGGSIVKRDWMRFYKEPPSFCEELLQSWDLAFKESQSGSYVVGQVWGRSGADIYLLDQVREHMDFTDTLRAIRNTSRKWPNAYQKLIEDAANGPAVIASLKREVPGITPVKPQGSKEARLYAVSPAFEAGNVYLPDPSIAPWVLDYVEEIASFPNGKNDDQVDATSQALVRLMRRKGTVEKPRGW